MPFNRKKKENKSKSDWLVEDNKKENGVNFVDGLYDSTLFRGTNRPTSSSGSDIEEIKVLKSLDDLYDSIGSGQSKATNNNDNTYQSLNLNFPSTSKSRHPLIFNSGDQKRYDGKKKVLVLNLSNDSSTDSDEEEAAKARKTKIFKLSDGSYGSSTESDEGKGTKEKNTKALKSSNSSYASSTESDDRRAKAKKTQIIKPSVGSYGSSTEGDEVKSTKTKKTKVLKLSNSCYSISTDSDEEKDKVFKSSDGSYGSSTDSDEKKGAKPRKANAMSLKTSFDCSTDSDEEENKVFRSSKGSNGSSTDSDEQYCDVKNKDVNNLKFIDHLYTSFTLNFPSPSKSIVSLGNRYDDNGEAKRRDKFKAFSTSDNETNLKLLDRLYDPLPSSCKRAKACKPTESARSSNNRGTSQIQKNKKYKTPELIMLSSDSDECEEIKNLKLLDRLYNNLPSTSSTVDASTITSSNDTGVLKKSFQAAGGSNYIQNYLNRKQHSNKQKEKKQVAFPVERSHKDLDNSWSSDYSRDLDSPKRAANMVITNDEDCSICLEKLGSVSQCAFLPCSHRFHRTCILSWFQKSPSCSICRSKVDPAYMTYLIGAAS